jgi:hypothetical protein
MDEYSGDEGLRKLQFTNKWVCGLKNRYKLRRRRCTTTLKPKSTVAEVRAVMADIQRTITDEGITADRIFNEDETAIFSCPALMHQYVPVDVARAITPEDGSESRFTALMGSSGTGQMLPIFMVLKVNPKQTLDLTTERTLKKVREELRLEANLEYGTFEQVVTTKKGEVLTFKRPYLREKVTLVMITVQKKALNDTVGMCMHAQLQLKPVQGEALSQREVPHGGR